GVATRLLEPKFGMPCPPIALARPAPWTEWPLMAVVAPMTLAVAQFAALPPLQFWPVGVPGIAAWEMTMPQPTPTMQPPATLRALLPCAPMGCSAAMSVVAETTSALPPEPAWAPRIEVAPPLRLTLTAAVWAWDCLPNTAVACE